MIIPFLHKKHVEIHSGEEDIRYERTKLFENVMVVMYVFIICILLIAALFELKTEYQIDIFPQFNTPFDDVYKYMLGKDQ